MRTPAITRLLYAGIAFAVFLLDRWSKWLVAQRIALFESIAVIPGVFKITHLRNKGAAFSLFADAPENWRLATLVIFSLIALAIVLVLLVKSSDRLSLQGAALALILGGAVGNLWDRVLHGWVTDFILVYYKQWEWPAFNVADSAICVGAVLLIGEMIFHHEPTHEGQKQPTAD